MSPDWSEIASDVSFVGGSSDHWCIPGWWELVAWEDLVRGWGFDLRFDRK